MDSSWISVVDTAVKIGLGAMISAVSGYLVLKKKQSHDEQKEAREQFYKLQEEKKSKYVELLVQSQDLIQSHLFSSCTPDSDSYKNYLRAFNNVQIISTDEVRLVAFNLVTDVQGFVFLNKSQQEKQLVDGMVKSAREKVSIFQKFAQEEVTKRYTKT
ncbi:hypothetical protein [Rhodanobacter sp. Root627]|uniref:hypothetical protein n=1 Tax=Rhodanobacter sp. Root627 TaxID=1736572 RepID=UPI0009E996DB|nr:hypothetical protein [Rhodanobacter sp. Root627]